MKTKMFCRDNGHGGQICTNVAIIVKARKCVDTTCTSAEAAMSASADASSSADDAESAYQRTLKYAKATVVLREQAEAYARTSGVAARVAEANQKKAEEAASRVAAIIQAASTKVAGINQFVERASKAAEEANTAQ